MCKHMAVSVNVGLSLNGDLNIHSLYDYADKGVGFDICKNPIMTPYSQNVHIRDLNPNSYLFFAKS